MNRLIFRYHPPAPDLPAVPQPAVPGKIQRGMHTTVKKFLNSLVPPFVDPNHVPKDVDKNWSSYKHARPQRVTCYPLVLLRVWGVGEIPAELWSLCEGWVKSM